MNVLAVFGVMLNLGCDGATFAVPYEIYADDMCLAFYVITTVVNVVATVCSSYMILWDECSIFYADHDLQQTTPPSTSPTSIHYRTAKGYKDQCRRLPSHRKHPSRVGARLYGLLRRSCGPPVGTRKSGHVLVEEHISGFGGNMSPTPSLPLR
jgi:hypothetical protein